MDVNKARLQEWFLQLKNKLRFASTTAARAAHGTMFGNGIKQGIPASVGFDLHVAANILREISTELADVSKADLEIKREVTKIARDLQAAYALANGPPYPNHVSTACTVKLTR